MALALDQTRDNPRVLNEYAGVMDNWLGRTQHGGVFTKGYSSDTESQGVKAQ